MRALLALVVVLLALVSPAQGQPALRLVAPAAVRFASDSARYVAYTPAGAGTLRVLDTWRGSTSEVPVPAGCHPLFHDSGPGAVAYPRVLLACDGPRYILVHARTGAVTVLPTTGGLLWFGVGRRWARGEPDDCRRCEALYDLRTGAVRRLPRPVHGERDLDASRPRVRRTCAPHRGTFEHRFYDPPYLLGSGDGDDLSFEGGVHLLRCGSRTRTLVTRRVPYRDNVSLGAGIVSWADPGGVHANAYDVVSHRRWRWRAPGRHFVEDEPVLVAHTRRAIIVAVVTGETCGKLCAPDAVRLYTAPLR